MSFDTFLGIDQTGSTNARGEARALDVALLYHQGSSWYLKGDLKLKHLEKEDIENLLTHSHIESQRTLIALDSVFGFPTEAFPANTDIKQMMRQASLYTYQEKEFGSETAFQFFNSFLSEIQKENLPHRLAESEAKANSIFRLKPYQKNIGCGTFRSWKELGKDTTWFNLWPFENTEARFVICEAYPTLLWKKILGSPTRSGAFLKEFLKKQKDFKVDESCLRACDYADKADALALCIGAFYLARDKKIFHHPDDPRIQKEGWIMGLNV